MSKELSSFNDNEMGMIPSFTSNRNEIEKIGRCVCINCYSRFSSKEITEWARDKDGDTACCPYCSVDMVIPEPPGEKIPQSKLKRWHDAF